MGPVTRSSSVMMKMKKEFLRKWVMTLQMCKPTNQMSLLERKNAIKLSADMAMASTRSPSTLWSKALISNISNSTPRDAHNSLNDDHYTKLTMKPALLSRSRRRIINSKMNKIRKMKRMNTTSCRWLSARRMARRMVKKRTEVLRGLVPGGEGMDECSLIREALDYIFSLRAQVDVMHHLATITATAAAEK